MTCFNTCQAQSKQEKKKVVKKSLIEIIHLNKLHAPKGHQMKDFKAHLGFLDYFGLRVKVIGN